jgi:polysaccharide export outer membrane protein
MAVRRTNRWSFSLLALLGGSVVMAGCQTYRARPPADANLIPHELRRMVQPPYMIEPPDVLQIDALDLIPKPPFRIRPLDGLIINAQDVLPREPVAGTFGVDPEGFLLLPFSYGKVFVAGLTLEEAVVAIEKQLKAKVVSPKVSVALATSRALQQVRGAHLVNQDGTVSLGTYGAVTVAGLTVPEAKAAIELHLSRFLLNPEVSVIVVGYNSKVYYMIFDQGGNGETITRLPITGNETVLDAFAQTGGLVAPASTKQVWIARPAPDRQGCEQILPIDILAITKRGDPTTNYQLLPGDRIFVKAQTLVALETNLDKIFTPIERVFGVALLGVGAVESLQTGSTAAFTGGTPVGF